MRLKNKAPTWYRESKLSIAPGATVTIGDVDGYRLLQDYPWHFEKAGPEEGGGAGPPPPPVAGGSGTAPMAPPSRRAYKRRDE